MTIDELLSLAGLTANDEIPVWDAEAADEATKKIKAQNLAASVKALAGLVGEAELTEQLADKASAIVDTAGGAIASFPDGAAVAAKDITIGIEPVQDLHGYDHPWPAGGGKNLLDYTLATNIGIVRGSKIIENNGITLTSTANDCYIAVPFGNIPVSEGETVIFSWETDDIAVGANYIFANNSVIANGSTPNVKSISCVVPSGVTTINVRLGVSLANNTIHYRNLMVRKNGDATFNPYSNICPISGWTGANVTRMGKNLLPTATGNAETKDGVTFTPLQDGSVLVNGTATATTVYYFEKGIFRWNGMSDFWISGCPSGGNSANGYSLRIGANVGNYSVYDEGAGIKLTARQGSITNKALSFEILVRSGTICNNLLFKPMLNEGLTAQSYVPYNPASAVIPISWQSEAGTVYGGTLDVTTGLLTVDKKQAVFDGSESWSYVSSGQRFVIIMSDIKTTYGSSENDVLCNELGKNTSAQWALNHYNYQLWVEKSGITSLEDFKSWLNQNNLQVVYPLATPQTYQLTPTEVDMLLGDNNVWADTGDSTVTYRADTKLYIQKINAPTDDDMISDAQIASGRYFIVGGNLYKSTTTIPAGDTINPGSNCTLTNLADALNALNT